MFSIAILIGIYSYILFSLGVLGYLYKEFILISPALCGLAIIIYVLFLTKKKSSAKQIFIALGRNIIVLKKDIKIFFVCFLFLLQALINLVGALGPELGFDALWYHLTLPKIYLDTHVISHIPGGLLYYSDMPKLGEMLYIPSLAFVNETGAKITHFFFGILISVSLFLFTRKFFPLWISVVIPLIFYTNLVVGWESITAYIDLIRTYFEFLALWSFINWMQEKKLIWFIESAVMLGLAITTKLLALGSLASMLTIIVGLCIWKRYTAFSILKYVFLYSIVAVIIPMPWFVFSYTNTGNILYPLFTDIYSMSMHISLFNPLQFLSDVTILFTRLSDPISPLYILFLPLIGIYYKKMRIEMHIVIWYCLLALFIWYVTPHTGGGRFILPYLPAFSIVCGAVLYYSLTNKILRKFTIGALCITVFISHGYRGLANAKYIPVLIGIESKNSFLINNLNFSYGDFYDVDGYFAKHIRSNEKVLLYGFHNLFYVDFPFIDSSWIKKGDTFNYIAVQGSNLPPRFINWTKIYQNKRTHVALYSLPNNQWEIY